MIRNYLKATLHNLWQYQAITFITVFGLVVGLMAYWLLGLSIQHEMTPVEPLKEVLGDRVRSAVALLSADFIKLILITILIARKKRELVIFFPFSIIKTQKLC